VVVEAMRRIIDGNRVKSMIVDDVAGLLEEDSEVRKALKEAATLSLDELTNGGYTVDTVKCAFAAFLQADDFENGLLAVVNRGNDADTVGAVAGALLGAYYGIEDIPDRWTSKLKRGVEIRDLAKKIYREG
jgi:ADP-ribosyl-[dinitrogen reductase] hydrolase